MLMRELSFADLVEIFTFVPLLHVAVLSVRAGDAMAIARRERNIMARMDIFRIADVCRFMLVSSFKHLGELLNVRDWCVG